MGSACLSKKKVIKTNMTEVSKYQISSTSPSSQRKETTPINSSFLAWSSFKYNSIRVMELATLQIYADFGGVRIKQGNWTHLKETPNTKLLVSLNHFYDVSANMAVFGISQKAAKKIYTFEEMTGVVGPGDVTFNPRRGLLGALPLRKKTAYHLYSVGYSAQKGTESVQLLRRSKWHPQYDNGRYNSIVGLDFNPSGETMATIDGCGICLISNVSADSFNYYLRVSQDQFSRCRWSINTDEPLLFMKYDNNKLNILDVEKKVLLSKELIQLDMAYTYWIDVCQRDGNLLTAGGSDKNIKIFDKRESKIVKILQVHQKGINCVRWGLSGEMLASASNDGTVKLLDIKNEGTLYTGACSDGRNLLYFDMNDLQ